MCHSHHWHKPSPQSTVQGGKQLVEQYLYCAASRIRKGKEKMNDKYWINAQETLSNCYLYGSNHGNWFTFPFIYTHAHTIYTVWILFYLCTYYLLLKNRIKNTLLKTHEFGWSYLKPYLSFTESFVTFCFIFKRIMF